MPIHDQSYRRYGGPRESAERGWLVIARTGIAQYARRRPMIGLLFFAGYWWAHYSGSNRWLVGMAIALLGTSLVLLAVPLGG